MIFVTVGSTHFDGLIAEVDRLAGAGLIGEEIYAQIGSGVHTPKHFGFTRYVRDMAAQYRAASLVICHGGVGTIGELLVMGKPFIAVPNRDLQDDHQSDLLRALESEGICRAVWDLPQLEGAIRGRASMKPYQPRCSLGPAIWRFLGISEIPGECRCPTHCVVTP